MSARQLAVHMGCLTHAVYRLGKKLEANHFVVISSQRPRRFSVTDLPVAFEANRQRTANAYETVIAQVLGETTPAHRSSTLIELITGRQAIYNRFIEEANKAQLEILDFSIGIADSKELEIAVRKFRSRGVEMRLIVQKEDMETYHIIKKWQQLGIKVRYLKSPIGFHLMVFDTTTVILTLSNPSNTEERTSIVFQNATAAKSLREYYFNLWVASRIID